MQASSLYRRDLVLVGGGHAHALALRSLAMSPLDGLRITLVSPDSFTPYSGMLPGLVAGHYRFEEAHIDLARLCQWGGVRFVRAAVTALHPQTRSLKLAGRPPMHYDLLSIDIGSSPEMASVPGAAEFAVPVKPVASFWQRWQDDQARLPGARVAVVGGGAGSVELILAMAHRLVDKDCRFTLYCGGAEILQGYNGRARAIVMRRLASLGIDVQLDYRVAEVTEQTLHSKSGERAFDRLFWCTGATAAPWIAGSGLPVVDGGFLAITDTLQSTADQRVFGAGDIATQVDNPRPKAGVYAVRQAPVLAHNLQAALMQRPLKTHRPQSRFLSLLSLGDRSAVADRGVFSASGAWVWRWKNRIDQQFMSRFAELAPMDSGSPLQSLPDQPDRQAPCGGCGAKLSAAVLTEVLSTLAEHYPEHCLAREPGDDAVALPTAQTPLLQSIDTLRQLVDDPYLMGRIAANHALSDLYACGAQALSALATVSLPFATEALQRRELLQVLGGALDELVPRGCVLAGGHSTQGAEFSLGFAVTGSAPARGALRKRGLQVGDALLLTKALGTGALLAGHMQLRADGRDIDAALAMMLTSNAAAAELAVKHGVSAATDVTGFGLAGHLLEMLDETQGARLQLPQLPLLPGVASALAAGIVSSNHVANRQASKRIKIPDPVGEIVFDPQTSGGLLFGVAPSSARELLRDLHAAGYADAAIIGEVVQCAPGDAPVEVVT
ncbi:MAG: selenide, water dikinase SelD [Pseudomonadota bacterium]